MVGVEHCDYCGAPLMVLTDTLQKFYCGAEFRKEEGFWEVRVRCPRQMTVMMSELYVKVGRLTRLVQELEKALRTTAQVNAQDE